MTLRQFPDLSPIEEQLLYSHGQPAKVPAMPMTVAALFAEREVRRRQDQEANDQLQRRHQEELAEFRRRLENFQLTEAIIQSGLDRIKRAFDHGSMPILSAS